jgi:hypothetical protein
MWKQLAHGVDIDRGPQKTGTPGGRAFTSPLKSTIFMTMYCGGRLRYWQSYVASIDNSKVTFSMTYELRNEHNSFVGFAYPRQGYCV